MRKKSSSSSGAYLREVGRVSLPDACAKSLSLVQQVVGLGRWAKGKNSAWRRAQAAKALAVAARRGDVTLVRWLRQNEEKVVGDDEGVGYQAALHEAAVGDQVEVVTYLLSVGDSASTVEGTAVHAAASHGSYRTLKLLVKFCPRVDVKDSFGRTPLHSAGSRGHLNVVKYLLRMGARIDEKDDFDETVLHQAAARGYLPVVKLLVRAGARVDQVNDCDQTPLGCAAFYRHFAVVKFLVLNGAPVNQGTALHDAAGNGHLEIVKWLVQKGACVNERDTGGWTALDEAADMGHLQVVKFLVANGARGDTRNSDGQTPLHWAAARGHLDVVEFLVSTGSSPIVRDGSGHTDLHYAIMNHAFDVVESLLSTTFYEAETPQDDLHATLFEGAKADRVGLLKLLEKRGIDILVADHHGKTGLHSAAAGGAFNAVVFLLERGADARHADDLGFTPVMEAARVGHLDIFRSLCDAGATFNNCNYIARLPLHFAAEGGHAAVLEEILARDANAAACDRRGWTALHCAAASGQLKCVKILLHYGASVDAETIASKTAEILARERGHHEVATYLKICKVTASPTSSSTADPLNWRLNRVDIRFDGAEKGVVQGMWLDTPVNVKKRSRTSNFVEELYRWASLNHPHVVKLFGACDEDEPLFVFEHGLNGSLHNYIKQIENASRNLLWEKLYEAALGLQYLHDRDIVHGAIKCDSIVVSADGAAKLRNFGAEAGSGLQGEYNTQSAPEVLAGLPPSFESDVYEFSMCIVEAVTDPGDWCNVRNYLRIDIQHGKVPAKPRNLSDSQWLLVEQMLRWNPRERPNMPAVVRELAAISQELKSSLPILLFDGQPTFKCSTWAQLADAWWQDSTVSNLFAEIEENCRDLTTMSIMNRDIHDRLLDVFNQLKLRCDAVRETLIDQYGGMLLKFRNAIKNCGSIQAVQFAASRQGADIRFALHVEIDRFVKTAELYLSAVHVWRDRWEVQRRQQQREYMEKLASLPELVKSMNSKEQQNALTYLQFELSKYPTSYITSEASNLTEAKATIASLTPTKNKSWFIPEYEIEFDEYNAFSIGGYGSVHHGKWKSARVVVKKMIVDNMKEFLNEVSIWHRLYHPHVVQLFGACHINSPFFVCAFAGNGQLNYYLKKHPNEIWVKLHEAALGLRYLNVKGVVHGDLKLNNILVGGDGLVKLTDFGLSSFDCANDSEPESDLHVGNTENQKATIAVGARWKSPEVLKGKKGTFASDIFSFGMCIIEAVSGILPWGVELMDVAVAYWVKRGVLPQRPAKFDDHPYAAWRLVEKMCRLEPSDRMEITELIVELKKLATASPLPLLSSWKNLGCVHVNNSTISELLGQLKCSGDIYERFLDVFNQLKVRHDSPTIALVDGFSRLLVDVGEVAVRCTTGYVRDEFTHVHEDLDSLMELACVPKDTEIHRWRDRKHNLDHSDSELRWILPAFEFETQISTRLRLLMTPYVLRIIGPVSCVVENPVTMPIDRAVYICKFPLSQGHLNDYLKTHPSELPMPIDRAFYICKFAAQGHLNDYLKTHPSELQFKVHELALALSSVRDTIHHDLAETEAGDNHTRHMHNVFERRRGYLRDSLDQVSRASSRKSNHVFREQKRSATLRRDSVHTHRR